MLITMVLYVFFWVIPRCLNFICRRFGTLCLFHLHRQVGKWFCSNHKTYAMSVYHPPIVKPTGDTHHNAEACGQVVRRNRLKF